MAPTYEKQWLIAPESASIVRVRMIDTTATMTLHSQSFIEPVVPGHERMSITDVAFLIENEHLGKKAIFDLGVRKDFWNLSPKIRQRLDAILTGLKVDRDVADVLQEGGMSLDQINDIIWSHSHWDHTGDPSLFPPTTNLVYGPGISSTHPAYPINQDSPLLETSFSGRNNHEIDFDSSSLTIGGFKAYDFYGDGSFYLLETPGHSRGHMCGLARTTSSTKTMSNDGDSTGEDNSSGKKDRKDDDDEGGSNSTFILFGGDVCHFCGDLRPNETYPLGPDQLSSPPSTTTTTKKDRDNDNDLTSSLIKRHPQFPSSPTDFSSDERTKRSTTPWYNLSTCSKTAYDFPNPAVAQRTVNNLRGNFDEMENVFVALAHDTALLSASSIPTLNAHPDRDLNDWKVKGYKQRTYWGWVEELDRGEKDIVSGFWRDGKRYEQAVDLF